MTQDSEIVICVLLYGNYSDLHKRILASLATSVPSGTQVRLWANQICQPSYDFAAKLPSNFKIVRVSSENVPKYVAMREMFAAVKDDPQYKWLVWLDDDSWATASDWLAKTKQHIEDKAAENICYIGQTWFVHHLPGQQDFIRRSTWYHGVPFELIKGKPGISFHTGGYFWLRTDILKRINWPDHRLSHNGGDTLLGEAIRQCGLPRHHFDYGVKVNDAPRRGKSEAPAGSLATNARR